MRYLERLSDVARDLPKARRRELLGEIELHIRMALSRTPCANRDEMIALLEQVGDPAEIAAAANDQADASLPGTIASLRTRRPRKAILALVVLTLIALAERSSRSRWAGRAIRPSEARTDASCVVACGNEGA